MTHFPDRDLRLLFVCTGNICRSAMAQAFLRMEAEKRALRVDVRSTGTRAVSGAPSTFEGRLVMSRLGAPIDDHIAVALAPFVVDWADVILGMSSEHAMIVSRAFPQVGERTFTLRGFVDVLPSLPPIGDLRVWLSEAAALGAARSDPDDDIGDPMGRSVEVYDGVAQEIRDLIAQLADGLERTTGGLPKSVG